MLSGTEPGLLSAPAFIKVGFLKSPTSALRFILCCCDVRLVRLTTSDLRALNLKLFILPTFLFLTALLDQTDREN
jgi:hypothetical protein